MKILMVTDAWEPQINGVVRTLQSTRKELEKRGCQVTLITPAQFPRIPCPTYPEISLALPFGQLFRRLDKLKDHAVHIATEGPLGLGTRWWCLSRKIPFTTSFTTRFPEYLQFRFGISPKLLYDFFRWFHHPSWSTMVSTQSLMEELKTRGFNHLSFWSRGVDTELFHPSRRDETLFPQGPIFLSVGRVAVEKNLPAFLELDLPGTKVVVGKGPDLEHFRKAYPQVLFTGALQGRELARAYASADVFVFPSKTDTFGMVMLEAMASGVPVAAFNVTGPKDVILPGTTGVLARGEDLGTAALKALEIPRDICRKAAEKHSWETCTGEFLNHLVFPQSLGELSRTG